jgi:hypothetical protein
MFELGLPHRVRTKAHFMSRLLSASWLQGCPYPHCEYSTSPPSGIPHESVFKGSLPNQVAYNTCMALISEALKSAIQWPRFSQRSLPRAKLNRIPWSHSAQRLPRTHSYSSNQCTITHSGVTDSCHCRSWDEQCHMKLLIPSLQPVMSVYQWPEVAIRERTPL